jgi:HPt (histidine-containing phosphotransfer) domain-containing protein
MSAPLDWDRFQTLADGEDSVRELADFFVPYVAERLDALQAAVDAGTVGEVEQIAHQLAGSTATAGATEIVIPLLALEQMAHDGGLVSADAAVREAQTAFARIREFLQGRFEAGGPHA